MTAPQDATPEATQTGDVPATDRLLYRAVRSVKSGQIERFQITYLPQKDDPIKIPDSLWVKVRNTEPLPMRAAFIAGPYLLYVDCRSDEYDPSKKCFITANQPSFESQLQPLKSFYAELSCHTIRDSYSWTVDVVSQMIFNSNIDINFEIAIGTSREALHGSSEKTAPAAPPAPPATLQVHNLSTFDLWNTPVPDPAKPTHLVVLTHGLHSNVSADMLYLKEQIDAVNSATRGENVVVKGYFGNICKTERGIKYLGSKVGEFIVDLVQQNERVKKISFIGHSLGGLVQTFAIGYIQLNFPWFFQKIKPINFVTIALPMLGASNENPIYVNLALLAGIVGRTGQDLSLRYHEDSSKPLLLLLPSGPTHRVLKRFLRRTIYANVANDGVVPLRTSALLYLDYQGLSSVLSEKAMSSHHVSGVDKIPDDDCVETQSMLPQPLQGLLSKFMPQRQGAPAGSAGGSSGSSQGPQGAGASFLRRIDGFHNSLVLETAQSLILPPLPSLSYIVNPEERDKSIIYEREYGEKDLPPSSRHEVHHRRESVDSVADEVKVNSTQVHSFRKRLLSSIDVEEFERIEEQIARSYHRDMTWRKVLVRLKPDAHNNIIVRRRFANAYGWPVIEHLVNSHFSADLEEEDSMVNAKWSMGSVGLMKDDVGSDLGLIDILSRDLIKKENQSIEEMEAKDHQWINTKDQDTFFTAGPASIISEVSEMVGNLRDQWYKTQNSRLEIEETLVAVNELDEDCADLKQTPFL